LLYYTNLNHRELENARSEKTVAFERAKVLKERLEEQTERIQTESKQSQETEAAQREVLREYRALKYDMTEKNEELSSLKHNITMIEKRSIEVEQRNSGMKLEALS
jgi:chromosome segregation ATPase